MPIYEYQCKSCGHELEKLQRLNDEHLSDCPACGAPQLRRMVSAAGFRLKGAGWYETDFKKDGKKNLHDAGESKSSSEDKPVPAATKDAAKSTDSKKTETKPAAKKPDTA